VSTRTEAPAPAKFRPQVFSTSRRLAPPATLRACFIPLPRPGFSPFRDVVPVPQGPWLVAVTLPPCRCPARAHRRTGCHPRSPRLRGFAPRSDALREPVV
jgi:hypothetical protein